MKLLKVLIPNNGNMHQKTFICVISGDVISQINGPKHQMHHPDERSLPAIFFPMKLIFSSNKRD